jgi:hypothetical protein
MRLVVLQRGGSSRLRSIDDVASRLVASTLCDVSCRIICGCYNCIYFLLTTCGSCDVSIFVLNALVIRLAGLGWYICGDH